MKFSTYRGGHYQQPEVGTRYFESTDGTFSATLLKKYRRHFIR